MNRAELIDNIAERLEQSRKEAADTLDAVVDEIKKAVLDDHKLNISGLGIWQVFERGARTARNPQTGETVKVKATKVVKFRPASDFKAMVSGARKATAGAKKAPAKKAPAKKTTAKKAPAKKAPAKKTTAKKAPAKKAPAKKTAAKKTTAKKATTRK